MKKKSFHYIKFLNCKQKLARGIIGGNVKLKFANYRREKKKKKKKINVKLQGKIFIPHRRL